MSDHAHKTRGIEDEDTGDLLVAIQPRTGFVNLVVKVGCQPLGCESWLYAVKLLVEAGLKVWPDAGDRVVATVERARGHGAASEKDAA